MHDSESQGYSLFETFAANRGCFRNLKAHWLRLSQSAAALDLTAPDWPEFKQRVLDFHDPDQAEVIRLTLRREGGRWAASPVKSGLCLHKRPWSGPPKQPAELTISDIRLGSGDPMRRHKTGSRLVYQLGLQRAIAGGFDDCLFLDVDGRFLESAISNLFVLVGDRWLTPSLDLGLLPGITRKCVLERNLAQEAVIRPADLLGAEAVVLSNSVQGLRMVTAVDEKSYPIEPAQALIEALGEQPFTQA